MEILGFIHDWVFAPLFGLMGWHIKSDMDFRNTVNEFKVHVAENYLVHSDIRDMKEEMKELRRAMNEELKELRREQKILLSKMADLQVILMEKIQSNHNNGS